MSTDGLDARSDDVLTIAITTPIDLPVDAAWSLLTDLSAWWPGASLEATPGGRFVEHWTDGSGAAVVTTGQVVDLRPPVLLRLSWRDDGWAAATLVEIDLEELPDGRTRVTITHRGWEQLADGAALAAAHEAGWRHHLDALARQAHGTAP